MWTGLSRPPEIKMVNDLQNIMVQLLYRSQENATAGILVANFKRQKLKNPKREEAAGFGIRCFFLNTTLDKNSNDYS